MGLGLLILFLSVLSLAFLYLNIRKNEISEELLLRVNREFPGEFTVGSISVGDLFAYPNLEIKLNKLQFWESKAGSGKRRKVIIDVPSARFKADLKDVLKNNFRINRVELKDPKDWKIAGKPVKLCRWDLPIRPVLYPASRKSSTKVV